MPNTYNFARETYDHTHDTYDFDSQLNSETPGTPLLDSTLQIKEDTQDQSQMTHTQQTNDSLLDMVGGSKVSLAFKNSEGQIEELGPNWP